MSQNESPEITESTPIYEDLVEDFDASLTDIGSLNTIHDRYQFESKFDFDLKPLGDEPSKQYDVDVYFFIPKTMGINSDTYDRQSFYSDLTNHIRIRTPELSRRYSWVSENWHLPFLARYFQHHLVTQQRRKLEGPVLQEVKLFGCFINTQLKNLHYGLYRVLKQKPLTFLTDFRRVQVMEKRLESIKALMDAYRTQYVHDVKNQNILVDHEVKRALLLVDEYNSYRLEATFVSLYRLLSPYQADIPDLLLLLDAILKQELVYRKNMGIINLENSSESTREYYYYRLGLLKKYVSEVLFLEVEQIKKEKTYTNMIAAFGAGLAAFWAALSDVRMWQATYGSGVNFKIMTFIFVGVFAYIFKDRIKDWTKAYFNAKLKKYLPDFEMRMFYTHYDQDANMDRTFLGVSREFVRYLRKDSISPDVLYIRELGHYTELEPERQETIIHYSKKLRFDFEAIRDKLNHVQFVKDVVRFDFSKFLVKLDEPSKPLRYFDSRNGVQAIDAPKVYHINVILRYAVSQGGDHKNSQVEFERMRLVINKKGIVRVEEVVKRGEMGYYGASE